MVEMLAGLGALITTGALLAAWRRRRPPPAVVVVAEPDVALLSSAAALRRLGARITRYDGEAGTLEAEVAPASVVRVRTSAGSAAGTTRLHLEGDGEARVLIRRFRSALST